MVWDAAKRLAASMAIKLISDGYLRATGKEVYWVSKDGATQIKAEGISGWRQKEAGIFTTQDSGEGGITPYQIVLYRAADGGVTKIADVVSKQAFFTLCQSESGFWYYFDQNDTEMVLYKMTEDFKAKQIVKTFPLKENSYNLDKCGVEIMNNRLYFYAMPDNKASYVLYRYDMVS